MGCDPLEVMLHEIKELLTEAKHQADVEIKRTLRGQAVEVASKLAPYLHPKLAMIALEGLLQHNHTHQLSPALEALHGKLSDSEIDVLEGIYSKVEETPDAPGPANGSEPRPTSPVAGGEG